MPVFRAGIFQIPWYTISMKSIAKELWHLGSRFFFGAVEPGSRETAAWDHTDFSIGRTGIGASQNAG
jgi:hypothetical protein